MYFDSESECVINESLLRTNIQKAVRQKKEEPARLSALHYLARTMRPGATDVNGRRKTLLARLPFVAGEDAGLCPHLAAVILHSLTAGLYKLHTYSCIQLHTVAYSCTQLHP